MGLIRRAASLASVPVTTGARIAGAATATAFGADRDAVYAKATAASVETLTTALAKARGPALKFGQALAVFSSALPPDQAAQLTALTRLYEDAKPQPLKTLEKQLKQLPKGVDIEPEAIAAASLGQVHRGTWTDGTPVAIKVQYADAPKVVKSDMMQLRAMAPLVGRLLPTLDVKALVDEHAARLAEELDYTHEAAWQKRFRKAWKSEGIVIPKVHFATQTLLVTEWVDGMRWDEFLLTADDDTKQRTGEAMFRFTQGAIYRARVFNGDPHPGNYRFHHDGTVSFLDFGLVKRWAPGELESLTPLIDPLLEHQPDVLVERMVDAGFLFDAQGLDPQRVWEYVSAPYTPYLEDDYTFAPDFASRTLTKLLDRNGPFADVMAKLNLPPSPTPPERKPLSARPRYRNKLEAVPATSNAVVVKARLHHNDAALNPRSW